MAFWEFTIRVGDIFKDTLIQRLSHEGCLGMIENDDALTAYFPDSADVRTITNDLQLLKMLLEKAGPDHSLCFSSVLIPDQDWNESWKKGLQPADIGKRFTILPTWEKRREGRINLIIDPGMAFGTGHHETTRSCLILMEKFFDKQAHERFLDVGTGTGILAIAASKLGYKEVVAVDTDPLAVDAARRNISHNDAASIDVREGGITSAQESFDFITANLFSELLIMLAPEISTRLNRPGNAVLAGMLSGQEQEVIDAMENAGLHLVEKLADGKWVSLAVGH